MAEIELLECWVGVTEPLRALMGEIEREVHAMARYRWTSRPCRRVGHG
jgi:hypothetical protein